MGFEKKENCSFVSLKAERGTCGTIYQKHFVENSIQMVSASGLHAAQKHLGRTSS